MSAIFIKIFNLGVTAGWIVLAVLLLRPLLQRAPKWINCLLWGIVGLRLIFPFSLESVFSLIPSAEPLPSDITMTQTPAINSGIGAINTAVNPIISDSLSPAVGASVNPMQIIVEIAAYVWVIGIALMLIYGTVSYIRLALKVRVSVKQGGNIYFCDEVDSPFILGVIRPRIYLPSGMRGEEMGYVIEHEEAHLKRRDHLWKPIGYALLSVYWFNPLLWVAYVLLCRDIEMACDERVIKRMDSEAKKGYSEALVVCSIHRKRIMACPLAFGEVGVKARIKSVLNYKKPAFWVIIVALVATVILSVCFLTDPVENVRDLLEPGSEWRCDGDAEIEVTVDNMIRMTGSLSFEGQNDEIVIRYRNEGKSVYADIFKSEADELNYDSNGDGLVSADEYSDAYAGPLLFSGVLRARGEDFVLKVEEDNLGIGEEKLVFKKTRDSGNRTVKITDGEDSLYVNVTDCGSEKSGAEVSFTQAKLDGDDVVFVLKWKNRTAKVQLYGKSFEVYRYVGDELLALVPIGAWKEIAVGVSAFSMSYPMFNITEYYNISEPGRYRFECYGAWVEFEVVNTNDSDYSMVYDTEIFDIDGDGKQEICEVGRGLTSGLFTFTFKVSEAGAATYEYYGTFYSDWMDFEFISSEDGKPRLQGTTQNGEVRVYDVGIEDGHVILTREGETLTGLRVDKTDGINLDSLRVRFPDYFDLDTSKGLDVIVWQMAGGSYSFGLVPHSEARDWLSSELWDLKTARAADMRVILSSYDISEDEINIVPWQNPVSSYIGDYWHHTVGEDSEPYRNMYIAIIRDMILGEEVRSAYPNVYETEIFDVDGDGEHEICTVGLGLSEGKFMFCFKACESGEPYEYYDTFYTEPMSLKFFKTADGNVRLRGVTEKGEVVLYDISIKNGHVKLTETDARTYLDIKRDYLDFAEVDFSMINYIVITDGTTGEKTAFRSPYSMKEVNSLLAAFKQIKGSNPVSNRGYYGFSYHVSLCMDYQEIYSFGVVSDTDGAYLLCGVYESVGGFDYYCRYNLTNPSYEYLAQLLGKYVK